MPVKTRTVPSAIKTFTALPTDAIWRLGIEQYHAMIRTGILTDDDPVELLEGWLVTKMPKNPSHRVATQLLRKALEALIPPGWYVDSQEPITLSASEPEPDLVVVRGDTRQYLDRHPGPEDVALIVEVADTTLIRDRGIKKRLYAREQIPVYWILDLVHQRIEVYSEPIVFLENPDYQHCQQYDSAEMIPVFIEDSEVGYLAVHDVLPHPS